MSILINKDTKVITQGITGKTGQFHTRMCRDYANGKNCFVAGVNPKKAAEDGGGPYHGLKPIDIKQSVNGGPGTDAGIMIGEIGGPDEADAARWCKANMKKPIVGFIAGVTAPPGKRMGHAGALISGGADTADAKLAIMEECGFTVTRNPSEMGKLLKGLL